MDTMNRISAMVFAAGLGTRLYPLTENKPKALVEIQGKTLLEHVINKLIDSGIKHIVVNVHHFSNQIINFLNSHSWNATIDISDESNQLLDTAGGLKLATPFFNHAEHILLYNVDILSNIDLLKLTHTHKQNDHLATLAVQKRDSHRYFIFDSVNLQLCGWVNQKNNEKQISIPVNNPVLLAFSGIHIVKKEILDFIPENSKISFTPLYIYLSQNQSIKGYIHQEDEWADIGKYENYLMNKEL